MRVRTLFSITAVLPLGLAGCGGGGEDTTSVATPPNPPPTSAPTPPPSPAAKPKPKPEVTTIRIVLRGGKVKGGPKRTTVKKGENVAIVIGSDVADYVHLHGYDRFADVGPGKPARLTFVASLPGRFEVELEDRGVQIADIEVRP